MTMAIRIPKPEGCSEEQWQRRRKDVLRIWEKRRVEDGVEPLPHDPVCQTCWSSVPAETRCGSCGKTAHVECLDEKDNCQECGVYTPSLHRKFWSEDMRRRNPDPVFPPLREFDSYGRLQATPLMPWGNDGNTCFISSTLQVLMRLEGFCRVTRTDSPLGAVMSRLRHSMTCGNETTLRTAFIALISYARERQWQQRADGEWGTGDPQVFARHLFDGISEGGADLQREFIVHVRKEYRCPICAYTRARTKRYPFIAIGQPDTPATLQERIHWYFDNEDGRTCTRCVYGWNMPCTRRIEQGPPHLLVNVKHDDTSDTTPPQMLRCPGPDDDIYQYQLIGAVVYSRGHFTSVILHDSEYWHLGDFDFRRAEPVDWQSVNMLVYNRIPPTSLDGMEHRPSKEDGRNFQSGWQRKEEGRGGGLSGPTNNESQDRDQNASPTPERAGGSPMDATERETGQHYEQSESPGLSYPLDLGHLTEGQTGGDSSFTCAICSKPDDEGGQLICAGCNQRYHCACYYDLGSVAHTRPDPRCPRSLPASILRRAEWASAYQGWYCSNKQCEGKFHAWDKQICLEEQQWEAAPSAQQVAKGMRPLYPVPPAWAGGFLVECTIPGANGFGMMLETLEERARVLWDDGSHYFLSLEQLRMCHPLACRVPPTAISTRYERWHYALGIGTGFPDEQQITLSPKRLIGKVRCAACDNFTQEEVCRCCWRSSFVLNCHITPETLRMPQRNCSTPHKFCAKCGAWLWWKRWSKAASTAASDYIETRKKLLSSAATHGQPRKELEHDLIFKTFTLIMAIVRPRQHPLRSPTRTLYSTPTAAIPHGIHNLEAVGGNICFISAILQLLVRIPEFIVLLSCAATTLGKGLYQILHALSSRNLNEYDPVLISWIECAGQHGLRSITLGTAKGVSGDPSEFLLKLLDRLGTLEGSEFQEKVQLLFEQRSIRRLSCPECNDTRYHEHKTRMLCLPIPAVRRPDLTRMILDPQQEKVVASCSCSVGPAQCKQRQLISTMVRTRTEGGQYQWLMLQRTDKGVCPVTSQRRLYNRRTGEVLTLIGSVEWLDRKHHYIAHVSGSENESYTIDDHRIRVVTERLVSELHRKSYIYLYGRVPQQQEHSLRVGVSEPCFLCDVPGCRNGFDPDAVCAKSIAWLSGRHRGIFARRTIHSGEYVATFGQLRKAPGPGRECLLIQNSSGQKEYFRWKYVDTAKHLGALANSTCCNHHCNAEIVHTGALSDEGTLDQAWIRMLKSVNAGEEILVYYGDSYFTDAQCRCCRCTGKCGAKALSLHDRPW